MDQFTYASIIEQVKEFDEKIHSFFIKLVLIKSDNPIDDLCLIFGTIKPVSFKSRSDIQKETIEYTNVVYKSRILEKDDLVTLLTVFGVSTEISKGSEKTPFQYANDVSPHIKGIFKTEDRRITIIDDLTMNLNGLSRRDFIRFFETDKTLQTPKVDTHSGYYSIDFSSSRHDLKQFNNLFSLEQPYYPDVIDLILEKFSCNLRRYAEFNGKLHLRIPQNFKGEIETLDLVDELLYYKVSLFQVESATLKIFIKDDYKMLGKSFSIPIDKVSTESSLTVPFEPNWIDAILLDEHNKIIHKISKPKETPSLLSRKPEAIEHKISLGEGLHCDFKQKLPSNNDKILKLLCAFANTDGGDILLGVDDNANIIGLTYQLSSFPKNFDEIENKIQNLIDTHIDPPIKVEGFTVTLKDNNNNDQEIGVLRIDESNVLVKNKLENEYYIRRGSTNRIAKPTEITELAQKKQSRRFSY